VSLKLKMVWTRGSSSIPQGFFLLWRQLQRNHYFILQQVRTKTLSPAILHNYRILLISEPTEVVQVATANDYSSIKTHWDYIEKHLLPDMKKLDFEKKKLFALDHIDKLN